jgi:hypothetical protein
MQWRENIPGFEAFTRRGVQWRWLCWLWGRIYRRWLWDEFFQRHYDVEAVKGWRTARVVMRFPNADSRYNVRSVTPCFWWFD